jgi:ABC-type transport system involved in multi-copper enzyme maturation permease subunit
MIKTIIYKEISGIIRSNRFQILAAITMLVFLSGGLLHMHTAKTRMEDYLIQQNKLTSKLQENCSSLNHLAPMLQYLVRKPGAWDLISLNGEKQLPDLIYYDAFYIGGDHAESGIRYDIFSNTDYSNYKLQSYEMFDWIYIAGILLSFFILVLTYDAFSGEKQQGTLILQCAFPVSRLSLFLAKYLAFLLIISVVFLLGGSFNLLVMILASGFQLTIPSVSMVLGVLIPFLCYFSFFILLGLWFSSRASQPATSLAYSLFTWLILVFFLPSGMSMLGEKIRSIPSAVEHRERMFAAETEVWDNAPEKAWSYGPPWAFGGKVYPHMALRKATIDEMTEVRNDFSISGFNDMMNQARLGVILGKCSPYMVLRSAAESMAGNGLMDFERDFHSMVTHRQILIDFIEDKDAGDPESYHFVNAWHPETYSSAPVAPDEVPRIEDNNPDFLSGFRNSLPDLGLLFLFNLLVLAGGWIGFLKYDVR